ncbi:ribosome recycling factor [Candidatus Palauibacter sp.]|uniref:ribosome recycling factor n=1 Tax=Candidatus Palauibacter sp. TaxID=3101350 RepID=UPI003AF31356
MPEETLDNATWAMESAIDAISREFATVRTGKATPAILDGVRVEAYGALVQLRQVANVSAPEPTMLLVQPYDPNIAPQVARAIQSGDLGLNPSVDGAIVRVPIPPLTEERRREMVKILRRMAEEGRVSIRHARHEARDQLLRMQRDGEIGEDVSRRAMAELQTGTDEYVKKIDELLVRKEAEVMEV